MVHSVHKSVARGVNRGVFPKADGAQVVRVTAAGVTIPVPNSSSGLDGITGAGFQMLMGFDTALATQCFLYPETTALGQVPPIGPPVGTSDVRLIATNGDFDFEYTWTDLPQYGGAPGSMNWADNASGNRERRECRINPVDTSVVGNVYLVAWVKPGSDSGGDSMIAITVSNGGHADGTAAVTNGGMTLQRNTATPSRMTGGIAGAGGAKRTVACGDCVNGDWNLCVVGMRITSSGAVQRPYNSIVAPDPTGYDSNNSSDSGGTEPVFNYISFGGSIEHAGTGTNFWDGQIGETCLISGTTDTDFGFVQAELEAAFADGVPLPDALRAQDSGIDVHAYFPMQENDPWLEVVSGRRADYVDNTEDYAAFTSDTYNSRAVPNRLGAASTVRQQAYTSSALATKLPWAAVATDYGMRVATSDALTADYGAPPDADTAPTVTYPAGASLQGGGAGVSGGEIDIKSASDTGTAYFVPIDYEA